MAEKTALTSRNELLNEPEPLDLFGDWCTQPHQDGFWRYMEAGGTRACLVWHRRAGKDDVSLRWTMAAMLERVGTYWHMLPQAEQARKAIWEAINPHSGRKRIDEAFPIPLRKRTRSNEMFIEFKNGSTWQVVGSDNFNALVGSPPVGVIFSEFSLANPAAWAYLRPILRENGGWAVFIYTPRGRNHGQALYQSATQQPGWYHELLDATMTDVFSPEELAEELSEQIKLFGPELGQAYFDQEYMVSFDAAVLGAVYAAYLRRLEVRGDIRPLEPHPDYPIHTAWDLGFGDKTSIWWWQILPGPRIRIVDHYSSSGHDITHYVARIRGREVIYDADGKVRLGDPIPDHAHRIAYSYGKHYIPHDGANKTLAAGGRSVGDQAYAMGVQMEVIPATAQQEQIAAARRTLEFCEFDSVRCAAGIEALRSYHYAWDEDKRTLDDAPVHDWSSHDSDSFELIGQVWQPNRGDKPKQEPIFLHNATADQVFWPEHERGSKWKRERI